MPRNATPRPWTANAIASGRIIGDARTPGAEKIQINGRNCTVATVYRADDALLIAAAPDLLAACEGCSDAFASWQLGQIPGRPDDILRLVTMVRDAIAKAQP